MWEMTQEGKGGRLTDKAGNYFRNTDRKIKNELMLSIEIKFYIAVLV
jgi:hypothetical protein